MHSPSKLVCVVTELALTRGDATETVCNTTDTLSDTVADDAGDDTAEGVLTIAALRTVIIHTPSVKKMLLFSI